ncbi:TolC family protein [Prolixibacteraceae bacterium JC049]|nr:TolC family protein [Prolixibacteraceae bacterium JC049]
MKRIIIFAAAILFTLGTSAQNKEKWSLEKCINHALENNIQIKQKVVNTKYGENQLQQSKSNRLPSLSANMGQSMNFGRSLQYDNTYQNINSSNSYVSVDANVTLYQGSQLKNTIAQRDFELKASLEDLHKAKNDITVLVGAGFLEIMLAQELVRVAENQIKITEQQIDRTDQLVKAGSVEQGKLLELQAQYAQEELRIVEATNRLQIALLDLAQLLDVENVNAFDIEMPTLPELSASPQVHKADDIYSQAVQNRPEIRLAEYNLKSKEMELKVAKGSLYPTLGLGASYNNNYNNKYKNQNGTISFSDQLKNNERKSIGLRLSIPIFNKFQNKTRINNAQLQVADYQLQLENQKLKLRKDIETAYTKAFAALKRYIANQSAVASLQEAFRYMQEKYDLGVVTTVEFNEAKNNLTKSQSDLLQAKYEFIFRSKILDFYNGVPISL